MDSAKAALSAFDDRMFMASILGSSANLGDDLRGDVFIFLDIFVVPSCDVQRKEETPDDKEDLELEREEFLRDLLLELEEEELCEETCEDTRLASTTPLSRDFLALSLLLFAMLRILATASISFLFRYLISHSGSTNSTGCTSLVDEAPLLLGGGGGREGRGRLCTRKSDKTGADLSDEAALSKELPEE